MGVSELVPRVQTALEQALAFAGLRAGQWGTGDRNFLGKMARVWVALTEPVYRTLRQLDADWPPSADSSESALRRQAFTFGMDNGAGGYGFRVPQSSQGAQGVITGTAGTAIAAGTVLIGPDGTTRFEVRLLATIGGAPPGTGQATAVIDALSTGSITNLSPGAILRFESTPAGADPEVVIIVGTNNTGKDEEDPGSAQRRLALRLQIPPKGGAPQDYGHGAEAWAENAVDPAGNPITGIRAYGYNGGATGAGGGYDGVGGVMVLITRVGSGTARMPTVQQLDDIEEFIRGDTGSSGVSPIACSVRTAPPYMDPEITGITIKTRVVPARPDLAFDWRRGSTVYEVDSWDGTSKLTLKTTAPADLKVAIENAQRPRIFVDTRNGTTPVGPIVPPQARVTAWSDAAGKTTLTLELPLPVGWQDPSADDEVYAGQAAICDPATGVPPAILAYVDGLGPSRVSGLQDPNDFWADVCAVSGIDAAATAVLNSDGLTPLVERTLANETKIGIGSATWSVQDVQPPDNAAFGPGLWYATRIIVSD